MEPNSQLFLMLGRLEGKVDAFLSKADSHDKVLLDHDVRLKALEDLRSQSKGAAVTLRIVWGAATVAAGGASYVAAHYLPSLFQ